MKLRPVIFWSHLVVGLLAGLVILMMSATGVVLMYERQIVEWVERQYTVSSAADVTPLTADEILDIFRPVHAEEHHFYVRFVNREGAAVPVWAGEHGYLVDPYTGAVLREGMGSTAGFFRFVTHVHRWFAIEGNGFAVARAITAYSNLLFLFLIVTGVYLWLPRIWRWQVLKTKMFFNKKVTNAKARDFNWHHVFGFWALIPLFFIVLTATIFYFSWANTVLYGAFGEEVPERGGEHEAVSALEDGVMRYQALVDRAKAHAANNGAGDWYSIWMELGEAPGEAEFYIDRSIGHRPTFAYALTLDVNDGSVLEVKRHDDWSPGNQAWGIARFLHTGEIFGFVGQTIAGLASLAACLLVYTGLTLAWRRLVSPSLARRRARLQSPSL